MISNQFPLSAVEVVFVLLPKRRLFPLSFSDKISALNFSNMADDGDRPVLELFVKVGLIQILGGARSLLIENLSVIIFR